MIGQSIVIVFVPHLIIDLNLRDDEWWSNEDDEGFLTIVTLQTLVPVVSEH